MTDDDPYAKPPKNRDDDPYAKPAKKQKSDAAPKTPAKPKQKSTPANLPQNYNTWGEAGAAAWDNVKQDAADTVSGMAAVYANPRQAANRAYQAATSTVDTLDNALRKAPTGMAAAKVMGNAMMGVPAAVGDYLGTNYGTEQAIMNSLGNHPSRSLLDAVSAATLPIGGPAAIAAGRAPSLAARVIPAATTIPARAVSLAAHTLVNPGGAANRVSAAGVRGANAVRRRVDAVRNPNAAFINRTLGDNFDVAQTALNNPRVIVPGSPMTAAQTVTQDVNLPRLAGAGKAAERRLPDQAQTIVDQQSAANLAHLEPIGRNPVENTARFGTPVDDAGTAMAERSRLADVDYAGPHSFIATMDPDLYNIMHTPEGTEAYRMAVQSANSRGIPVNHTPPGAPPGTPPQLSGQFLQLFKGHMDTLAANPSPTFPSGSVAVDQASIRNNRNRLVEWMNREIPGWETARENFGSRSNVADRMMVSDTLQRELSKPLDGINTLSQRAGTYGNLIAGEENAARANSTIRNATGARRADYLDDVLPPNEMGRVYDVGENLSLINRTNELGNKPSVYSNEMNTIFSDALGTTPIHAGTGLATPGASRRIIDDVINAMLNVEGRNIAHGDEMANAILNPEVFRQMVNDTATRNAVVARRDARYGLAGQINRFVNPVRLGNRYPVLVNAMNNQQDQQR